MHIDCCVAFPGVLSLTSPKRQLLCPMFLCPAVDIGFPHLSNSTGKLNWFIVAGKLYFHLVLLRYSSVTTGMHITTITD